MTDHDTLIELQPLLRELGWWPERLHYTGTENSGHWMYLDIGFPDEHALAIVTQRAETKLCGRGWTVTHRMYDTLCCLDLMDEDGLILNKYTIADALRVEISRQASLDN